MNRFGSSIPIYLHLASLFRGRIRSGQWKAGDQIPTLNDLHSECGAARATIRQALDILEKEDLIERFRAKGTFVRPSQKEQFWCEIETDFAGLLRRQDQAEIELLSVEAAQTPPEVPHEIGKPAKSYRHLRRRHRQHGDPYLLGDVYIDERLISRIPSEDFKTKTALKLVTDIKGMKIIQARQTLTIGSADFEIAEYLKVPINSPVGFLSRSAVDQTGTLVVIANGVYRGEVVRVDIKIR
jgi:GntR family transcriptional regulator